jgi:amino acid adenylation domain-containing protein
LTSLIQFLSSLRALGVVLSLDGERMICNAPKGSVTPEIREQLADRKTEIVAFLRESASLLPSTAEDRPLVDLPLSRAQQRLWFLTQMYTDNPVYNMVIALRLGGALNRTAMERSLRSLVERHESLRTGFYEREGRPFARIIEAASWKTGFVDLSLLSLTQAEEQARQLIHNEARKPFNLEHAPLFRGTLFRVGEDRHLLLLVLHHIISDGWSLGVLAKELGDFYSAFAAGLNPNLPEILFQYRDFVRWEQQAGEQAAARQLPFWMDRLSGTLPVLELPGDRPRPPTQTFAGRRISIGIGPPLAQELQGLCRDSGTTPFMLLLAAFKAVLSRYSGLDDILVGSGASNRQRQEFAPLAGFFVNNLVLRTDLSGNPSFRDLLARLKETALSAYAHQDVPFGLLVEKLQPERSLSQSPLIQIIFTLQNVPMPAVALPGLDVEVEPIDPGIARADLAVEVWPVSDGYRCDFEYNTDIFDEATIQALQSHYLSFLRHAVADPSLRVKNIPLSSDSIVGTLARDLESAIPNDGADEVRPRYAAAMTEHPLSRSQQRLWFLNQLDPGNPVYNIAVGLRIEGALRRDVFEETLQALVDRHESLRTVFRQRDGLPYASVEGGGNWRMHFTDLSSLPAGQRNEAIAFAEQEAQRPFAIDRDLLFRVALLRISAEEHLAVMVMHHIISDGWSLGVLSQELGLIYSSLVRQGAVPLLPPCGQFRDFVAWEQKKSELSSDPDILYWRGQLAGELPTLELATDFPRPPRPSLRGNRIAVDIPVDLSDSLQKVGRERSATFFMILLAAFNVLLRQYSGQDDILVGTPTAGRSRTGFEGIVGFFVNNLVLRADLSGNPEFVELVGRVQKTALDAFEHQSTPFDQLVEVLQPERTLDRSPIFQVMFTLQNAPTPPVGLDNLRVTPVEVQSLRARYDLAVDIYFVEATYRCFFEYNADLFEEGTIRQMQRQYLRLLEAVALSPTMPLRELSALSEAERHRILEDWNRTEMAPASHATVPGWFQAQTAASPEAAAVVMGKETLSYRELDAQSTSIARLLRARGAGKGTIVGVYLDRSPQMVAALLGILKAGAAYLPLDPALPAQRLRFMLSDSEVPMIVTQTALRHSLPESGPALLMIDDIDTIDEPAETPLAKSSLLDGPSPEDLAYIIYTSGSTGNPKGTEITHSALVNLLASMLREPGLSSTDTLVAITTISFDIAALEIFGPLVCGAKVVLASRDQVIDPDSLGTLIEISEATVMQATPSTWRALVESGWMGRANLRMWSGGEPLPTNLAESLLARGRELWNLYGPTETTIWSAAHRVKSGENPILIGKPIGNTRMYILDGDLQPAPAGVSGELYIAGAGVARGYWRRPELTEARFLADPFDSAFGGRMYRTGDLARYRPDGQIQLIGRTDNQIKLRGHRIELEEIERVLERHADVLQAVVTLHEQGPDRQLVAYIKPTSDQADAGSLRPWLLEQLPEYMVPGTFHSIEEIPLTPNGKVDRKRLPKPKPLARELFNDAIDPRNRIEEQLAKVWSEILGVGRVSVRSNFFDLGGHSLLLVRVREKLRHDLDFDISVVDLFRYPTIESLAAAVERRNQGIPATAGASLR